MLAIAWINALNGRKTMIMMMYRHLNDFVIYCHFIATSLAEIRFVAGRNNAAIHIPHGC